VGLRNCRRPKYLWPAILFCALLSCSRTSRSIRALRKAGTLLSSGDLFREQGLGEKACRTYESAAEAASLAASLCPEASSLGRKAGKIQRMASNRALSFTSPEGAALCLMDAMRAGDLQQFRLFCDIETTTRIAAGEEMWRSLSPVERERLMICVEAVIQDGLLKRPEYFRAAQERVVEVTADGGEGEVIVALVAVGKEARLHLKCRVYPGGWKAYDFEVSSVGTRWTDYTNVILDRILAEVPTIHEFLATDTAEEVFVREFAASVNIIPNVEDSLAGRIVILSDDPLVKYQVIRQTQRGDGLWLLVHPTGGDVTSSQWVKRSEAQIVNEEAEIWGMDEQIDESERDPMTPRASDLRTAPGRTEPPSGSEIPSQPRNGSVTNRDK